MDMSVRHVTIIGGVEVRPGAEWRRPTQRQTWLYSARCESIAPDRFTAGVLLNGEEMIRTSEQPSIDAAYREAEGLLSAAFRRLFASPGDDLS